MINNARGLALIYCIAHSAVGLCYLCVLRNTELDNLLLPGVAGTRSGTCINSSSIVHMIEGTLYDKHVCSTFFLHFHTTTISKKIQLKLYEDAE